jgi:hypothetical protein
VLLAKMIAYKQKLAEQSRKKNAIFTTEAEK